MSDIVLIPQRQSPLLLPDILRHVFSYLRLVKLPKKDTFYLPDKANYKQLRELAVVCRQWNDIASEHLWKYLRFGSYEGLQSCLRVLASRQNETTHNYGLWVRHLYVDIFPV